MTLLKQKSIKKKILINNNGKTQKNFYGREQQATV